MSTVERKDDTEAWKEWFRVPVILWAQVARADPTRGLVCTNRSGIYQLYAWDVPTGGGTTAARTRPTRAPPGR